MREPSITSTIFPLKCNVNLNMKNDTTQTEWYCMKELACNLQNVMDMRVKERLKNCFLLKETKETQRNARHDSELDPFAVKGVSFCHNWQNLNGVWRLDGCNVSVLIPWFVGYIVVMSENVLVYRKHILKYLKEVGQYTPEWVRKLSRSLWLFLNNVIYLIKLRF